MSLQQPRRNCWGCNELTFEILGFLTVAEQCRLQIVSMFFKVVINTIGLNIPDGLNTGEGETKQCIEYLMNKIYLLKHLTVIYTNKLPITFIKNLMNSNCRLATIVIDNLTNEKLNCIAAQSYIEHLVINNCLFLSVYLTETIHSYLFHLKILNIFQLYITGELIKYFSNCRIEQLHLIEIFWDQQMKQSDIQQLAMKHLKLLNISSLFTCEMGNNRRWCNALCIQLFQSRCLSNIYFSLKGYAEPVPKYRYAFETVFNVQFKSDVIAPLLYDGHCIKKIRGWINTNFTTYDVILKVLSSGVLCVSLVHFIPEEHWSMLYQVILDIQETDDNYKFPVIELCNHKLNPSDYCLFVDEKISQYINIKLKFGRNYLNV